jgi:hypothetical protein
LRAQLRAQQQREDTDYGEHQHKSETAKHCAHGVDSTAPDPRPSSPERIYESRDHAGNALYQIVRDHFETFRAQAASLRR